MRRFAGSRGLAAFRSWRSAIPRTSVTRAGLSPVVSMTRRAALARSADSSQLLWRPAYCAASVWPSMIGRAPAPSSPPYAALRVRLSSSAKVGRSTGSMLRRANSTHVIGESPRAKASSAVRMQLM